MRPEESTVAVVGLGYVGLPLAVEFGKKLDVVGYDINPRRVEELRAGRDHTLEVSEDELGCRRAGCGSRRSRATWWTPTFTS